MEPPADEFLDEKDLAVLKQGGPKAVDRFLTLSCRAFDANGADGATSVINQAFHLLPFHERNEIVAMFFLAIAIDDEHVALKAQAGNTQH